MTRRMMVAALTVLLCATVWLSASGQASPQHHDSQLNKSHAPVPSEESRGERVFKQNCSRCHSAPQGFPPQISGTVLRHMRVRASLSAPDEKALLEFMNP